MSWQDCERILIIRPDNMGDLIMSGPAIRALKRYTGAHITLLTSSAAAPIAYYLPAIDNVMVFDLPWVKTGQDIAKEDIPKIINEIKNRNFDAAVIFTVFSQSSLPSAMLTYMANIPKVLAYCRENPYHLITDWVPDTEPYKEIKHQVTRDLELVAFVGASYGDTDLFLNVNKSLWKKVSEKLERAGAGTNKPWLVLHCCVSEQKREYPIHLWAAAARQLIAAGAGYQVILTGSSSEKNKTDELQCLIGAGSFSMAGTFTLEEFICLIKYAPVVLSVNTGTVHIAAAVKTPVVVLYARTNPQHTPWKICNRILPFSVPAGLHSKNEVLRYLQETIYKEPVIMPTSSDIVTATNQLLNAI